MKINQVAGSVRTQQVQRKGRSKEAGTSSAPAQPSGDHVEISSEARKLQDTSSLQAAATKTLENTSEVRNEKLSEVKQRIAEGFYNQNNIAAAIADKLLEEFGI